MAFRAPVLCLGDITFTLLSNATMHDIIPRRPTAPSVEPHTDQCLELPMLWLAEDLFSRNRERHWLLQEVHQALCGPARKNLNVYIRSLEVRLAGVRPADVVSSS